MMPDHVHLLVEAEIVTSDLVSFVAKWTQATGYLFRQELPQRLWQRRFYAMYSCRRKILTPSLGISG
jgi:REP element-mobilizing transposase RayT